jgi:hypothetical protein
MNETRRIKQRIASRKYFSTPNGRKSNSLAAKRYSTKLRVEVLRHYGQACSCCGESTQEFLCIDHIKGGGGKHRNEIGSGYCFYLWLRSSGYPDGYRVLCHNCNMAIGFYGYCPHDKYQID